MKSFSRCTLMALFLGLATASIADARPRATAGSKLVEPPEVTVTGCVTKGSGSFCWNMKGDNGASYSFAGQPAIEGKCYTVTGKETLGTCRAGTQLGVTKFDAATYDCCTEPLRAPKAPATAEPAAAVPKP